MNQKEIEEFKEWLSQVRLSFTEAVLSSNTAQSFDGSEQYLSVKNWLSFFETPTFALEHHYRANKKKLAEFVNNLKLPDSDKSNILCCFNAWLALEWCHDAKLIAPNNHNLKELEAIIAALQDSGYAVKEQNTYEYKLLNGEQSGRFWWWEAKGKWVADFGWVERLIQQVLASPELQIRLPESPINETYMDDDLEDCLSRHKFLNRKRKSL